MVMNVYARNIFIRAIVSKYFEIGPGEKECVEDKSEKNDCQLITG